jgi:hypothetical protein
MEENDVSLPKGKQATSSATAWQSLLQLWMKGHWLPRACTGAYQHHVLFLAAKLYTLARTCKHASIPVTCCFQQVCQARHQRLLCH